MARKRVLGVLAGADMPPEMLRRWVESTEVLLAADGGADRLREIGVIPHATIGDLDSISPESRMVQDELVHDTDQNTSDCDKLLALAQKLGHTEITLASMEGDLLDHMLGTLSSAIDSPLDVRLALRRGIGWILKGDVSGTVSCRVGSRVSLLPLAEATRATMMGVEWPFTDWNLRLGEKTSLSNRAIGESIAVHQQDGASLLFVEYPEHDLPIWPEEEEVVWYRTASS